MNQTLRVISSSVMTAFLLVSALAQGEQQDTASLKAKRKTGVAAQGSNTAGRIAKFTDSSDARDQTASPRSRARATATQLEGTANT